VNIEITKELYERLANLAQGFESPNDVIERLLDSSQSSSTASKPELSFIPSEEEFKQQLLTEKHAWKKFEYLDGTLKFEPWLASRFSVKSNLRANLWSGALRDWQNKGIKKLTLSIEKPLNETKNILNKEGCEIKIQVGEFVKDHLDAVAEYCTTHPNHLIQLLDRDWCKEHLFLQFPMLSLAQPLDTDIELHKRYWVKVFSINNEKYRFCSQLGGNTAVGTNTLSEHHGKQFLKYLKLKDILLFEYNHKEIYFTVKETA
jgi:predicted CopG family antitoxin